MTILFIITCLATSALAVDETIPQPLIDALIQRRDAIKTWACQCPPGPFEGTYSTMTDTCWQGDMVCFAGLSCLAARLAGDDEYADARADDVLRSQSDTGRWHRGPMWRDVEYAPWEPTANDFSRDQTRGVFAYFLADGYISQDPDRYAHAVQAAEKWMAWMEAHDQKHCLEDSRTCEWTAGTYNMAYNTYRLLGIIPGAHGEMYRDMYGSRWYYGLPFLAELRTTFLDELDIEFMDKEGRWYPRHLKWQTLLMYRVRNMDPVTRKIKSRHYARLWGKAARRIWGGDRQNPLDIGDRANPLYRLGYEGATVSLANDILNVFTHETIPTPELNYRDWAWQRHTEEQAWLKSDGHDQLFLLNLFLAKATGKINW